MQLRLFTVLALVFIAHGQNATETQETAEGTGKICEATQVKQYSLAWHISAIFIVLACSGIGIFSTLSIGTMTSMPIYAKILQIFKMFGIGVIAGTGWCHLIPDAFNSFTSECLPDAWAAYGPGFVGVFALAASFIVQTIELASGGGHSHGHGATSPSADHEHPDLRDVAVHDSAVFKPETETHERSKTVATIILEAGILFHSIVIGVSLGVTGDDDTFRTLLIAICFHQFFEGLALGAMIAKLNHSKMYKFFVMGLLYPLTTPVGMIIGIAVRSHFNENAHGTIITEGIFNSLSAGILLYNTYTELLATEVNHNKIFKDFSLRFKSLNMLSLYMGAATMAILAYWA